MSMGAVYLRVGSTKGTDLGGLYKSMPWTTGFCLVGAASISAVPLFSGFVTKSMIMFAAATYQPMDLTWLWFILLFASAGVLEHAGIKIPYFAFFAHDSGKRPKEAPLGMRVAMGLSSVLCILIGCFPQTFYQLLPGNELGLAGEFEYSPYTLTHIVTQVQLLFFAARCRLRHDADEKVSRRSSQRERRRGRDLAEIAPGYLEEVPWPSFPRVECCRGALPDVGPGSNRTHLWPWTATLGDL